MIEKLNEGLILGIITLSLGLLIRIANTIIFY